MSEFQSSQLTFPANREFNIDDQYKSRSPSESIDMDDEEAVYWHAMKSKILRSLKLIRSVGLPIIRCQTSPLPSSIRDLIFRLREEENPLETREFKLLISGLIQGQVRSSIFKLATQIQAILEDRQFEVEFDGLINIITEISTFTNQASEGTTSIKEMFTQLEIKLPQDVDVGSLTTCANETFTVIDPLLLSYWIPVTMFQQVVKIRDFIVQSSIKLKNLVSALYNRDYDESSRIYLEYINLKKSFWQPHRVPKVAYPQVSMFTPNSSKKSVRKQLKNSNLTDYFMKIQSETKQPFTNDGSIFKSLGSKVNRQSNFNQTNFEQIIKEGQMDVQLPHSLQRISTELPTLRRVYLHLHDSLKELRGFLIETQQVNPRNPFLKSTMIDYEVDSEDEVNEYLAEVCESVISSSEHEIDTDEGEFIVEDQLNHELMREYQIHTTYNQAVFAQINSGDYNLFQFFLKENKSPEMETYFNRYQIELIDEDSTTNTFPLRIKKIKNSQRERGKISELDDNHIQNFLLFLRGKRESRQILISLYKQVNPQFQRKALEKVAKEFTFKNQKGGGLLIKQEIIDHYDMSELLRSKVDPAAFFLAPENKNDDFLQGGTNLLQPKKSTRKSFTYAEVIKPGSARRPKIFLTTPSKPSKKKLI